MQYTFYYTMFPVYEHKSLERLQKNIEPTKAHFFNLA